MRLQKHQVLKKYKKFYEHQILHLYATFYLLPEGNRKSRVDIEYFYILLPYIKKFNKYCGLCVKYSYFAIRNVDHNLLLRCTLYCVGRPTCSFSSSVIVVNIGNCHMIVTNGTIRHTLSNKICRPIREPTRSLLKARFAHGATVFRVYNEQLQRRSIEERQAFNYDATGKSRSILRKIKSEQAVQSLLSSDVDE